MRGKSTDSVLARDILEWNVPEVCVHVRQRASNWSVAIGLQDVDHLSVSQFLIDTAKRNIRGEITQEEVARLIEEYHSLGGQRKGHCDKSQRA